MQLNKGLCIPIVVSSLHIEAAEHVTSTESTRVMLNQLINSDSRGQALRDRNRYRHPLETLTFFGLEADMTVIAIWPGGQGGWY